MVARSVIAPQRLAEILGEVGEEVGEHDVEADTDPLPFACIRVDGVLQLVWKDEQRPIAHSYDHLIGIVRHGLPRPCGLSGRAAPRQMVRRGLVYVNCDRVP